MVIPWWAVEPFFSLSGWRSWKNAGDDDDRLEWRVLPSEFQVVAMCRYRRWGGVVHCEAGQRTVLASLSRKQLEEAGMSFLKRAVAVAGGRGEGGPFPDDRFAKKWPAVFEYMTAIVDTEGKPRKPSSLTLFCEDGSLKAAFSDKDAGLVLFAAGKTLEGLLQALDGLLQADDTQWRKSGGGVSPKAKK